MCAGHKGSAATASAHFPPLDHPMRKSLRELARCLLRSQSITVQPLPAAAGPAARSRAVRQVLCDGMQAVPTSTRDDPRW